MQGPVAALLDGGTRLHLQHGPIDLIIGADADTKTDAMRHRAFSAAAKRFETVLERLVVDLVQHRSPLSPDTPQPTDPVAQRMHHAARPFCEFGFLTPMIAVAGSVADEVLAAMLAAGPLDRAYVNNGGDIAVHLAEGAEFSVAMAEQAGADLGRVRFGADSGIGGIATSGAGGRSFSLGIADSVTVLATSAAQADAAATLIANAVDLPNHAGIAHVPANTLQTDTDLGDRLVVADVPRLSFEERRAALARGRRRAETMLNADHIIGAAIFLQGESALAGGPFVAQSHVMEMEHA
ncbi:MAG: UPF0280 family protein [Pseudomonadota bacterium]